MKKWRKKLWRARSCDVEIDVYYRSIVVQCQWSDGCGELQREGGACRRLVKNYQVKESCQSVEDVRGK